MNNNINTVKDFLVKPEIHKKWINDYRNSDNEKFYNYVFDYLIDNIKPKKNSTILDFGCGTGVKSMHFFVLSVVDVAVLRYACLIQNI